MTNSSTLKFPLHRSQALRQSGTNLIEVMVALLILAIGLLGLAMLQLEGMKYNSDSYLRTQATFMANEIIERMRSNSSAATNYTAAIPGAPPNDCLVSQCSASQMAAFDLFHWSKSLTNPLTGLPGATTSITLVSGTTYLVSLTWVEKKDETGNQANQQSLTVTKNWTITL